MFGCTFCYDNALGGRVAVLSMPMGDYGDSEWFYMGYFSAFRRIFMQKLLRYVASDMAGAFTEEFPCQTARVKFDGGEFFAAFNSTSDTAEKIVMKIAKMPEGEALVLSKQGIWKKCPELTFEYQADGTVLAIYDSPLPTLSSLMFIIK